MFARTAPSFTQLVDFFVANCMNYGWLRVAIFFSPDYSNVAFLFKSKLTSAGVRVEMDFNVPFQGSVRPALPELRRKMLRIVIVITASVGDLRQWMLDFLDEGMTGPGWAFVGGYLTSIDTLKGVNTWMGNDGRDADVILAVNGYLTVSPAPPASTARLTGLLQRAAQWDTQTYPLAPVPAQQWSGYDAVYAGFAYDACRAISLAADAEIRAGGDALNGTSLMRRLLGGMPFDSVMGRNIILDSNGDVMQPC